MTVSFLNFLESSAKPEVIEESPDSVEVKVSKEVRHDRINQEMLQPQSNSHTGQEVILEVIILPWDYLHLMNSDS